MIFVNAAPDAVKTYALSRQSKKSGHLTIGTRRIGSEGLILGDLDLGVRAQEQLEEKKGSALRINRALLRSRVDCLCGGLNGDIVRQTCHKQLPRLLRKQAAKFIKAATIFCKSFQASNFSLFAQKQQNPLDKDPSFAPPQTKHRFRDMAEEV